MICQYAECKILTSFSLCRIRLFLLQPNPEESWAVFRQYTHQPLEVCFLSKGILPDYSDVPTGKTPKKCIMRVNTTVYVEHH